MQYKPICGNEKARQECEGHTACVQTAVREGGKKSNQPDKIVCLARISNPKLQKNPLLPKKERCRC